MKPVNNLCTTDIYYKIQSGDDMLSDRKKVYGIILEKVVKNGIDKAAKEQERSSSWLINDILKNYLQYHKEKEKK